MDRFVVILHNLRSSYNVGNLLRTAEGLGAEKVYLSGFSAYPKAPKDKRLPHIIAKVEKQIHKTALGAEHLVRWQRTQDVFKTLRQLKSRGYLLAALEQSPQAVSLSEFNSDKKLALIVGSEIGGVDKKILDMADVHLKIPMTGQKDSFNVASAAAMAMYHFRHVK